MLRRWVTLSLKDIDCVAIRLWFPSILLGIATGGARGWLPRLPSHCFLPCLHSSITAWHIYPQPQSGSIKQSVRNYHCKFQCTLAASYRTLFNIHKIHTEGLPGVSFCGDLKTVSDNAALSVHRYRLVLLPINTGNPLNKRQLPSRGTYS